MSDGDPLRLLFAGTPEIGLVVLRALVEASDTEFRVVAVLTAPDAPVGRSRAPRPSPVKNFALESGIPVLQPERLRAEAREMVAAHRPDLLVSAAYGRIFGPKFLALFPRGGINVHPSLLPLHRGPSPLQAAILAGDRETGVTIQRIAEEVDAGDILAVERIPLGARTTVSELHDELADRGARLAVATVRAIAAGEERGVPQDHEAATFCGIITKRDGALTWRESADRIDRMVRAYTPWPGVRCAWQGQVLTFLEVEPLEDAAAGTGGAAGVPPAAGGGAPAAGTVLSLDSSKRILIQTTDGVLGVRRLKPQGGREMDAASFINGHRSILGSVLEQV